MENLIVIAAKVGKIEVVVGGSIKGKKFNPDDVSKEKMSAFRILAKEMGYVIGGFRLFDSGALNTEDREAISFTVTADIKK